jgi:hypothetical protein
VSDTSAVRDLRIEPSLVTARVEDETVTLSAPPIPAGIWAALDVRSPNLAQELDHTWEEPLVPNQITRVGSSDAVAAVATAFAEAIDGDLSLLLRWRGFGAGVPTDGDAWHGGELPELPAPARRPPDSVPKRFGTSGIHSAHGDLVEALVAAYSTLSPQQRIDRSEH